MQKDYETLIDAATWAFIAQTAQSYPEDAATAPIADQRRHYDAMCRSFDRGYPAGITARDHPVAGVPCRDYAGALPTILYLHGGGFVVGGLHSHDEICAEICAATGLRLVSADYRLSPEHPHPAALEDTLAVARALLSEGPLLLAGDSAGGNLAAAASAVLRDHPDLRGQVLIYPGLGGDPNTGSYLIHAHAPMLTRDDVLFYAGIRGNAPADPTASPLLGDPSRLPPTIAFSAECDPLADDALHYCARLTAAGTPAHRILEPGLVHGYLRARHTVPRAAASFGRITNALTALATGQWPYGDAP